jgi:hypothetical protein
MAWDYIAVIKEIDLLPAPVHLGQLWKKSLLIL